MGVVLARLVRRPMPLMGLDDGVAKNLGLGLSLARLSVLALAIVLEIAANIFLKYSDGFKKPLYGLLSLCCVLLAFSALAQAVKGIDLSIAYAVWGGVGIIATVAAGWVLFGQRLNRKGWAGLTLLLAGMILLKLA